jgi:hypothetical protein
MSGTNVSAAVINFAGFSSDGHPVSGSAEFTVDAAADTITVKLTNTTANTLDAGELFTGLDFSLGGLTPAMTSAKGLERSVNAAGVFSDTSPAQNLTWSLIPWSGSTYQLNFNPNAKHALLGPPAAGNYIGANPSIKGNKGHNPFAAEVAIFELSVPNLEANTPVTVGAFRFGTNLDPATPEPSSWVLFAIALVSAATYRRRRLQSTIC